MPSDNSAANYNIENLTEANLPELVEIVAGWGSSAELGLGSWGEKALLAELARGQVLGARLAGSERGSAQCPTKLLGFLSYRQVVPEECEIIVLASSKEHSGRGVMGSIFNSLVQSRPSGYKVILEVHAGNQRARSFYESLGFIEECLRPSYYADGRDAVLYLYFKR